VPRRVAVVTAHPAGLPRAATRIDLRRKAATLVAAFLVILGAAAVVARGAAAHGELVLQLGTERIQPGGTVEVRGDLGTGERFEIALISKANGSRQTLGTAPATEEGHLLVNVVIPATIATGDYLLEVGVDSIAMRAPLTVAGQPIATEGGEGPDRADSLIQPVASAGLAAPPPGRPATTPDRPRNASAVEALAIVGAFALSAVIVLGGLRWAMRRPRRAV